MSSAVKDNFQEDQFNDDSYDSSYSDNEDDDLKEPVPQQQSSRPAPSAAAPQKKMDLHALLNPPQSPSASASSSPSNFSFPNANNNNMKLKIKLGATGTASSSSPPEQRPSRQQQSRQREEKSMKISIRGKDENEPPFVPEESTPTRSSKRAKQAVQYNEDQPLDEEGEQYCICRSTYAGGFMISCDNCSDWFHGACVNITEEQSQDIDKYYCPKCIKKCGPSTTNQLAQPEPEEVAKPEGRSTRRHSLRKRKVQNYSEMEEGNISFEPRETQIATHFLQTLKQKRFSQDDIVKRLGGADFTLEFLETQGLRYPIMFEKADNLGIQIPSSLTVDNVKALVGSNRPVDVIDVATQSEVTPQWTLEDWAAYYNNAERKRLYNVISLEVSRTKLSDQVASPKTVRDIDWIDNVWPKDLPEWPKVQLYCLMSVAGAYTDFHIGSSVWYHVVRGQKLFLFVPPTPDNLKLYTEWSLDIEQHKIFFGDLVTEAGQTLIIPTGEYDHRVSLTVSGWIHAVYTPVDSLVLGGNFLHSYSIKEQLAIYDIEEKTGVPQKFRLPFYETMLWFVASHFLSILKGTHPTWKRPASTSELLGVQSLLKTLDNWLKAGKNTQLIPKSIMNPKQLLMDLAELLEKEPNLASTRSEEPWKQVIEENAQAGRVIEKEKLVERVSRVPLKIPTASSDPSPPSSPINEPNYTQDDPQDDPLESPPSSPEPPKRLTINISAAVLQQANQQGSQNSASAPVKKSSAPPKKDLSVRQRIAKKLGVKLKKF